MVEKEECPGIVIGLKDEIHKHWFEVQKAKFNFDGEAGLKKKEMDKIISLAKEALATTRECSPDNPYLSDLEHTIRNIESKLSLATRRRAMGETYYVLPKAAVTSLLIDEHDSINSLANLVHQAGISMLTFTGRHGGCKIVGDTKQVNEAALGYCEGIQRYEPGADWRGILRDGGTVVEHKLGLHSATIKTTETEKGYSIRMEYEDSVGYKSSKERLKGVKGYLEEMGIACELLEEANAIRCTGEVESGDDLREVALFLSGIKNVDLLEPDCIKPAIDYAKSEAERLNREKGRRAYEAIPKIIDTDDWERRVCIPARAKK